jgi:FkbM family methyltransferase
MYYYHDFESEQSQILISLAVQGGIFFDIGANIGFYSILMAKRGMKVVAFEPFPKLCDFIVGNVTLNEVRDRVSIVPEALSDSCGVTVYNPPREGNWGVGKIFGKNLDSSKEVNVVNPSIEVKTLTLDDAVKKYGLPSVMKVDIEGAEYLLLHNKPSILYTDNAPTIFIEFHPSEIELLGGSVAQLKDIFHNAGYQEYEVNQHQSTVHEWRIFSKSAVGSEFRRVDQ